MSIMGWFSELKGSKKYDIIEETTNESYYLKISKGDEQLFESIIDRCHCVNELSIKKNLIFKMRESLKKQGYE